MKEIRCKCGKLLCKYEEGYLYLYCKSCKEQKKISIKEIIENSKEPKSQD